MAALLKLEDLERSLVDLERSLVDLERSLVDLERLDKVWRKKLVAALLKFGGNFDTILARLTYNFLSSR